MKITIALDQEVVDYFKLEAEQSGLSPYQTQINKWHEHRDANELIDDLLNDPTN